jgi:hypothetical protein
MRIALWTLRNTVNVVFGAAIVRATFCGTSSADTTFANDYNDAEAMTRHQSRYHGNRPFAIIQIRGVLSCEFDSLMP